MSLLGKEGKYLWKKENSTESSESCSVLKASLAENRRGSSDRAQGI